MNKSEFKAHIESRAVPEPIGKKDLTIQLLAVCEDRIAEIEQKIHKITERITGAKYEYFHNRMQREKADLMEAYQFNKELIARITRKDDVH